MIESPSNSESNKLGSGVTEDQIKAAVDKSGYPLQIFVGDILREKTFSVQAEWSFVDRDSLELRSMDMRADKHLCAFNSEIRVRPQLTLLVECKQSQLPYIFFESEPLFRLPEHPKIFGLHSSNITLTTDDDRSTYQYSAISALDLEQHPFQTAPVFSTTFSKCVRKGSEIELSGTEAYSGLVLPLVKSLVHLGVAEAPVKTASYFDAHLSIALAVLDAPIITAKAEPAGTKLEHVPWVRVLRHEYASEEEKLERDRLWAVDVVHKDYLREYLEAHLMPFANDFSTRVLRHDSELASGKGFASGLNKGGWGQIEQRMRPR